MKKQTIKQKNKTNKYKNTKLNRSSFGVSSLLGGLKKSLEAMITQSKKLLKLYLENNPIRITIPLSQNPT